MTDFRPGDVTIEQCTLRSSSGREYDLRQQAQSIDIYESFMQPLVYGEIVVADAIGLRTGFPIIGQETLSLTFKTPTLDTVEYTLAVYNVSDIQQTPGNRAVIYTLKMCSVEALANATRLVNRRLRGQISETIQEIISQELGSRKEVSVEPSRGIDDHLVSNLTPLQTIDKLRHRCVSATNPSSSYVFFETSRGFHFKSLEEMIRQGRGRVSDKVFFYDDNIDIDTSQVRFRDILNTSQIQDQNELDRLQAGAVRNVVKRFDLLTGSMVDVVYDNEQYQDMFAKTADQPRGGRAGFSDQYGQTTSQRFLVPFSSGNEEDFIAEKVGVLHGFVEKIVQNLVWIVIYGDTSLNIGDVIVCNFSASNGLSADREVKTVTNNYMIAKIRHSIQVADRSSYIQTLELINNSADY